MIVDEEYKVQEKFGTRDYQISVDSPGFNQPINHYWATCNVKKVRKIEKLRAKARNIRDNGLKEKKKDFRQVN